MTEAKKNVPIYPSGSEMGNFSVVTRLNWS